jgi:hypothetical protein
MYVGTSENISIPVVSEPAPCGMEHYLALGQIESFKKSTKQANSNIKSLTNSKFMKVALAFNPDPSSKSKDLQQRYTNLECNISALKKTHIPVKGKSTYLCDL